MFKQTEKSKGVFNTIAQKIVTAPEVIMLLLESNVEIIHKILIDMKNVSIDNEKLREK